MPLHSSPTSSISQVSIPVVLDWWQQRKRLVRTPIKISAIIPKADDAYLHAYYRLMEVYSVVKSGGVQAQMEAVKAFAAREVALLNQRLHEIEIAAGIGEEEKRQEREKVEQELIELRCANDWRLKTLTAIDPAEEAIVSQHLPAIEKTLLQVQCA